MSPKFGIILPELVEGAHFVQVTNNIVAPRLRSGNNSGSSCIGIKVHLGLILYWTRLPLDRKPACAILKNSILKICPKKEGL